jgi:hypothetical protein
VPDVSTTPADRTAQQQLADIMLGRAVEDWLADQRKLGASWRRIARDLARQTEGRVHVTDVTVRAWGMAAGLPPGRAETETTTAGAA